MTISIKLLVLLILTLTLAYVVLALSDISGINLHTCNESMNPVDVSCFFLVEMWTYEILVAIVFYVD